MGRNTNDLADAYIEPERKDKEAKLDTWLVGTCLSIQTHSLIYIIHNEFEWV